MFIPRDTVRVKAPRNLTAWFGLDSAGLAARGVRTGAMIIGYKHAALLGGVRVTGRSSDDRTGSAALLMAVRAIDPATLPRKTYFVWDVGEEAGLLGARAFGARYGTTLARTYAIDTFVSSDTPIELPTFALAPLGKGPVLRGLDNSTVVSRAERERVIKAAKATQVSPFNSVRLKDRPTVRRSAHSARPTSASRGPDDIRTPRVKCSTCATSTRSASS